MPYASNTPISRPIITAAKADVNFNGIHWSYKIGLMFPSSANTSHTPIEPPPISTLAQPTYPSGGIR